MPPRANVSSVLARASDLRSDLARRSVKDLVTDKILSLIASGVLRVGDELPSERELASMLSLSRMTVRGAIQTLVGQGIVAVTHGARTRVVSADVDAMRIGLTSARSINSYDLEAINGARQLVEKQVVADAATRMDAATLELLDRSLEQQSHLMDDPVRFLICDREFHMSIYRSGSNPLLADFVVDLYAYMLDHRRAAMSQPGAIRRSYEDHVKIVDALKAGDPEATVEAFGAHIDRIYTTTRSLLAGKEEGGVRARR